jgi:hypothetical protein
LEYKTIREFLLGASRVTGLSYLLLSWDLGSVTTLLKNQNNTIVIKKQPSLSKSNIPHTLTLLHNNQDNEKRVCMNRTSTLHRIADSLPEFVACVGTHIWHPGQQPSPYFLLYVRNITAATNMDLSTSILALFYVYSLRKVCSGDIGSETKVLTVGCILANKFLQDTPFSASLWCKVTGFTLNQLFIMEREFLQSIQYRLYVPTDTFEAFMNAMVRVTEIQFPKFWQTIENNCPPQLSLPLPTTRFFPSEAQTQEGVPLVSFQLRHPPSQLVQKRPYYFPSGITPDAPSVTPQTYPPVLSRPNSKSIIPTPKHISPSSQNLQSRLQPPRHVSAMTHRVNKQLKITPPSAYAIVKLAEQRKSPLTPTQFAELVSRNGHSLAARGHDIKF